MNPEDKQTTCGKCASGLAEAIESSIGSGIAVIDESWRTIHVNGAFCRMIGCSREELLGGRPPYVYWPTEERKWIQPSFEKALGSGSAPEGLSFRYRRRNGERFPVLVFVTPLTLEGGARGWVMSVADVTALLSEMRHDGEQWLRIAQDGGHVGVWEKNFETGEAYWSPAAIRMYGFGPEVPRTSAQWHRRVHPDDRSRLNAEIDRAIRTRESFETEIRFIWDTGETRWLLSRGNAQYEGDRVVRLRGIDLDITERKRMEEAQRKNAELSRTILSSAMDGFALLDIAGRVLEANETYCEMLGYSREEILRLGLRDLEAKETAQEIAARAERLVVGRKERFETRQRRKDGSLIDVEISAQYLDIDGGRVVVFQRDRTEQKLWEKEMLRSQKRIALAQRASNSGYWDWDLKTNNVVWSPEYFRLVGLNPDLVEASIPAWKGTVHPEDLPKAQARIADALENRTPLHNEYRIVLPTGEVRFLDVTGEVFFDEDGKPDHIYGISLDVTARKQAESVNNELNDRFRRIHESLTDAFALVDMDGRLKEFNRAFQEMLGYSADELRQLTYMDLTPPKWHEMEARIVETQILRTGRSEVFEKEYVRKDGSVIPVELRSFLLRDKVGRPEGLCAIVRDLTGRERAAPQAHG